MARVTTSRNRWAIILATAAFTTALAGGAAFAAIQPPATEAPGALSLPTANALAGRDDPKKLKATLDALVAKGTITQAQEDAILQAVKDGAPSARPKPPVGPSAPSIKSFISDMTHTTTTYLGITQQDLATQLRAGKSIVDIAASLNKNTADLAALLTKNANDRIDQAVIAKKLTAEQAAVLKAKVATEVASFVQRSFKRH
jgi:hypothetical protein